MKRCCSMWHVYRPHLAFVLLFGSLRLGIFAIDEQDTTVRTGLRRPAAAGSPADTPQAGPPVARLPWIAAMPASISELATVADRLSISRDPWILGVAALIPWSLWACSSPHLDLRLVLLTRLLVILSMNFVVKESVQAFPVCFLLAYQMVLQAIMIALWNIRNLSCGKRSDLARWLAVMTPIWLCQLATSLFAFKATSVSTIQVLRSVMPLMSFAMEAFIYGKPRNISGELVASMFMVVGGTILYGYSSVSVSPSALLYILLNSAFTVMATVFRSYYLKDASFSVSLPLCMCSLSTAIIPVVLAGAVVTGEIKQWPNALGSAPLTAWFWATMSGLTAGCFSFLQGRCQQSISATSDLMFQNFVKIFLIVMGVFLFADDFGPTSMLACAISLSGCAWYGYLRASQECKTSIKTAVAPELRERHEPLIPKAPEGSITVRSENGTTV